MGDGRPPIKIRLKINKVTGEIEELIVDDQARLSPEEYHDKVAALVARALGKKADVIDTGLDAAQQEKIRRAGEERERGKEPEKGTQR